MRMQHSLHGSAIRPLTGDYSRSVFNIFSIFVIVISMTAIGLVVWRLVNRQERRDPKFQAKLDADDERARKGRESRHL